MTATCCGGPPLLSDFIPRYSTWNCRVQPTDLLWHESIVAIDLKPAEAVVPSTLLWLPLVRLKLRLKPGQKQRGTMSQRWGFGFVSGRTMGVSLAVTQCVHCPSQDNCRGKRGTEPGPGQGIVKDIYRSAVQTSITIELTQMQPLGMATIFCAIQALFAWQPFRMHSQYDVYVVCSAICLILHRGQLILQTARELTVL